MAVHLFSAFAIAMLSLVFSRLLSPHFFSCSHQFFGNYTITVIFSDISSIPRYALSVPFSSDVAPVLSCHAVLNMFSLVVHFFSSREIVAGERNLN